MIKPSVQNIKFFYLNLNLALIFSLPIQRELTYENNIVIVDEHSDDRLYDNLINYLSNTRIRNIKWSGGGIFENNYCFEKSYNGDCARYL